MAALTKPQLRRFGFRLLIAAAVLLAALTVWRTIEVHEMYVKLLQTPQGQAAGPANADVTIVEFMDYRCMPCHTLAPVMAEVAKRHPDVRIVYRTIPTHGAESVREAVIVLAAGKQGHFQEMHDYMMAHAEPPSDPEIKAECEQLHIDYTRLQTERHGQDIEKTELDTSDGVTVLGVKSVPAFLIGRQVYTTDHKMPTADDFDTLIAQARGQRAAKK